MNFIQLVQQASKALLKAQTFTDIPTDNIYSGIENPKPSDNEDGPIATRKLPCIIVECNRADNVPHFTGDWSAMARVKVRSSAFDSTDPEHQARVKEVFDALVTSTIAADLSALPGFTAQQVRFKTQGYGIVDNSWESTIDFEVEGCCSDIS